MSFHPDLGFVITVVLAVVGFWLTWKFSERDTQLYYELTGITRLMSAQARQAGLTVQHNGKSLSDPYVTTLTISIFSRREIEPGRFNGKALDFDLGATILGEVESHYSLGSRLAKDEELPKFELDGSKLKLGPAHIHNDGELTATLLLDGPPTLSPVLRTVTDVRPVRGLRSPIQSAIFTARLAVRIVEVGFFFLAGSAFISYNTDYNGDGTLIAALLFFAVGASLLVATGFRTLQTLSARRGGFRRLRPSPIPSQPGGASESRVVPATPPTGQLLPRGLHIRRPLARQSSQHQRRTPSRQPR